VELKNISDEVNLLAVQGPKSLDTLNPIASIEMKEIRLRPKTNEHHRGFKVKDARRWLNDGMKVKVTVRFRGREMDYPEIGRELLDGIAEELDDVGSIEQKPKMEGRRMMLILAPEQ